MYDFYSTWAWGTGIVVGFFIVVLFFINAKFALLLYVLAMPALQPLMTTTATLGGSKATIAVGGPLQAIILIGALFSVARSGIRSFKAPGVSMFLILWMIMGISIVESRDKILAIKEWGRIGSFVFIYIMAIWSFKTEKDIRLFVITLFISLIAPLSLAAYQKIYHIGFYTYFETIRRIMGTYGNPVEFAMSLTFPLLLCATIGMDRKTPPGIRLFSALGAALLGCFLFFSYTRSAWFGVIGGLLFIGVKKSRSLLVLVPLLAVLLVGIVSLQNMRLGEFATGNLAFSGRIGYWAKMLPLIWDHPILGYGLTSRSDYTQSDHIRLLLETGFLGWVAFLCLIGVLFKTQYKAFGSSKPGIERNFIMAYLAFFLCQLVISFSETNAMFQYYVWIPAGIALSTISRIGDGNHLCTEEKSG